MANERGLINYNGQWIPSSHSVRVELCGNPECDHVHFICFDLSDKPLCEMALTVEMLENALKLVRSR